MNRGGAAKDGMRKLSFLDIEAHKRVRGDT